jgi:hypothetical protein
MAGSLVERRGALLVGGMVAKSVPRMVDRLVDSMAG